MTKLCLNMIVRNEADRIERCLASVAPYISSYAILDTGSTDGTPEKIRKYLAALPGNVIVGKFENFEQARNDALSLARRMVTTPYDYILLLDADMEMKVDGGVFPVLTAPSYDLTQKSGGIEYANKRLIRRDLPGVYKGVTHEYLDCGPGASLPTVWFVDHADGSNRKEKFTRDIKLLTSALKKEPNNARYQFYLAQSYRDAKQPHLAADAYEARVKMGGWDQEVHNAQMNYASCLKEIGDEPGFVHEMLTAYNMRPTRCEPLYDLAKHYREGNKQRVALMFAEQGLKLPPTNDKLFVSTFAPKYGLKEEVSICSFYSNDPMQKARGFQMTNELVLGVDTPDATRSTARSNLYWYAPVLPDVCRSFTAHKIDFTPPDGYVAMNPSIAEHNGHLLGIIRCVNYTIDGHGRYLIRGTDGTANGTNPIHTRNFLVEFSDQLQPMTAHEILLPELPKLYDLVTGLEDMRLFVSDGKLMISACARQLCADGVPEQVLGELTFSGIECRVANIQRMLPPKRVCEKNWMPIQNSSEPMFVYRLGQTVNRAGLTTQKIEVPVHTGSLNGGSQAVPFANGLLMIVHESVIIPGTSRRCYMHRFVYQSPNLVQISKPFVFKEKAIEFAAGLVFQGDKVLVSFGFKDNEAWIGSLETRHVMEMLEWRTCNG